jgi:hypothetical protein
MEVDSFKVIITNVNIINKLDAEGAKARGI